MQQNRFHHIESTEALVYDLLIKGGHLIDPKNRIDASTDLAISDGKVSAVDADIPAESADQVADVTGLYVTPGLVDIHTHMYATPGHRNAWAGDNSILPDGFSYEWTEIALQQPLSAQFHHKC